MRRDTIRVVLVFCLLSSCYLRAGAQVAPEPGGAITGTFTYRTGGTTPARITANEVSTGKCYTTTTDSNGAYRLLNLPKGSYSVVLEAAQDRSTVKSVLEPAVQVSASQETVRNIQILPGDTVIDSEAPDEKFGYRLSAFGFCGRPARLDQRGRKSDSDATMRSVEDRRHSPALRLPPGGSLTDKVDLSKLMDLKQPETYVIEAKRGDVSDAEHTGKSKSDQFERSNFISVAVMAQPSSARQSECESRDPLQK